MKYSEYRVTPTYRSAQSGAAIRIIFRRVDDAATAIGTSTEIYGRSTGISASDDFEVNAVEEAGEDGVNEHAMGRHTGQGNSQMHFRAELNDLLPSRGDFLADGEGQEFTILEVMGDKRRGVNVPINVYTGCRIGRVASSQGARGLKTIDVSFQYQQRYTGQQWADLTGDADYQGG